MTKEVKRYGIHFAVEHMIKEDASGDYVLASDYAALEQEFARLRAESENIRARWTEYGRELEAERDAALLQVEALRSNFPRIDPLQPVPLDETTHCCEHTLYLERERLHRLIDAALQAKP
jgi:GDP-D-mannose dehydratase